MMTEAEGVVEGRRGGYRKGRSPSSCRDGLAAELRHSCDSASSQVAVVLVVLQSAVCGLRCGLQQTGREKADGRAPSATGTRSAGQARRRIKAMDGFLTEAGDADQRRAADGELDFQRRLVVGDDRQRAMDATQVGQSVKRDIKAGRQTAGRRPPRKVDRRVGQLAAA